MQRRTSIGRFVRPSVRPSVTAHLHLLASSEFLKCQMSLPLTLTSNLALSPSKTSTSIISLTNSGAAISFFLSADAGEDLGPLRAVIG